MQPFQCDLPPQLQETHRTTHTGTTTRCKTQRRNQFATETTAAATAAHRRYLSSPAEATLHGKTQGFVLWLPPQNIAHATFMQPFQCDLPPQLQETHRTTHTGTTTHCKTQRRNQFATETTAAATAAHRRYLSSPAEATLHGKTQGFVLRLPPQNIAHAIFMQPFQCDLPPQLQETHRTTHTGTTTRCKTQRRNQFATETTAAATAAHRRYLSSPAEATLHGKTQGFVLWLPPQNIADATFMQPFQCDLPPQLQEASYFLLCIVRSRTTLHHSQFHSFVFFCYLLRSRTTPHHSQFHSFLFFCVVLLCYVLLHHTPPFIIVNSIASYSFCYVLVDHVPPFIIVDSIASYSFVMYC